MFKQTETKIPQIADSLCLQVAKRKQLLEHTKFLFENLAGEEPYNGRYKDEELYWAIQNYLAGDTQNKDAKINMPKIKQIESDGKCIGQHLLECTDSFPIPNSFYNASCVLLKECGVECALIMADRWYDSIVSSMSPEDEV